MLVVNALAALFHFLQREDLSDLKVSLDDSSTAASTISVDEEHDIKGNTTAAVNDLCSPGVYRPHSWTILIHDQGDSVSCRIWYNEGNGFSECKNKEIFETVHMILELVPDSCFYLKTTGCDGHESVTLFESDLIVRALTTILKKAKKSSSIVIPNKEEVLFSLTREKKRGFLASLRFGARGRKSVN